MIIPFDKKTFSADVKSMLSGANLTLDYDNIQSTFAKVAEDMKSVIGAELYDSICNGEAVVIGGDDAETAVPLNAELLEYLKRAMIHFAVYHHAIYLIARISNDGIMVRKDDNMTTIYRYQQQELQQQLLKDGWFWLDSLIRLLSAHADEIPLYMASPVAADDGETPIRLNDFIVSVGINSPSFIAQARWITREVWRELIGSIGAKSVTSGIVRAVCYEVVARACVRLPYYMLPEPLRVVADNEQTRETDRTTYIRTTLADVYHSKSEAYMVDVRNAQKKEEMAKEESTVSTEPYHVMHSHKNKFYGSI